MKVYLSGGIAGMTFEEANSWRTEVTEKLREFGIQAINPLRGRMFVHSGEEEFNPNEIVGRDLRDIRAADLVLVYIPRTERFSIGTTCEMWHTYYTEHKPLILVSDDPRYTGHPWVQVMTTKVFEKMEPAVQYIVERWADEEEI